MTNTNTATINRRYTDWLLICAVFAAILYVLQPLASPTLDLLPGCLRYDFFNRLIPPLSRAAWLEAFSYIQYDSNLMATNGGITLRAFQILYFKQWLGAIWATLTALVFMVPALIALLRNTIPPRMRLRTGTLASLGLLAFCTNWYIHILADDTMTPYLPHAAALIHFLTLCFITLLIWSALGLMRRAGTLTMRPLTSTSSLRTHARASLWLAFICAAAFAWLTLSQTPNIYAGPIFACIALATLICTLPFALRIRCAALGVSAFIAICIGIIWLSHPPTAFGLVAHAIAQLTWLTALAYQAHRTLYGASTPQ